MRDGLYRMRGIRGDLSFRWLFLCRPARERFRNPFWREIHLRQRNAAIEHFAIVGNQSVLQPDLCDSSEKHPRALAARDVGGVGKTVARVTQAAVAQGIRKCPGEVA